MSVPCFINQDFNPSETDFSWMHLFQQSELRVTIRRKKGEKITLYNTNLKLWQCLITYLRFSKWVLIWYSLHALNDFNMQALKTSIIINFMHFQSKDTLQNHMYRTLNCWGLKFDCAITPPGATHNFQQIMKKQTFSC